MGDREEWTSWDHAFADVFQLIEDYSDEYGLLPWHLDDDYVYVDAVRRIHKFKAAVESSTKGSEKKPYKPQPGEYFIPKMGTRRKGGQKQTFREWVEKKVAENTDPAEASAVTDKLE